MSLGSVDLVVKFGGSAITRKDQFETLDEGALNTAVELIRKCHDNKLTCVIVHGAGSFGHHQAKEYKVNYGWSGACTSDNEKMSVKKGFCLTRQSVTKLHHLVLDALIQKDIPATGLSVCGRWKTENGLLVEYDLCSVREVIRNGFIPVLHGDCVLDTVKGCTILSGDTIIQKICEDFSVNRVVFLSSVYGIYDKPPTELSDSTVIKHITVNRHGGITTSQNEPSSNKMKVNETRFVNKTHDESYDTKSTRTTCQIVEHEDKVDKTNESLDEASGKLEDNYKESKQCAFKTSGDVDNCGSIDKSSSVKDIKIEIGHKVNDDSKVLSNSSKESKNSASRSSFEIDIKGSSNKTMGARGIETNICGKDVTGGMLLKINSAVNIVQRNAGSTKVFVCKAGSLYSIDACLHGKCETNSDDCGTEIAFSST